MEDLLEELLNTIAVGSDKRGKGCFVSLFLLVVFIVIAWGYYELNH